MHAKAFNFSPRNTFKFLNRVQIKETIKADNQKEWKLKRTGSDSHKTRLLELINQNKSEWTYNAESMFRNTLKSYFRNRIYSVSVIAFTVPKVEERYITDDYIKILCTKKKKNMNWEFVAGRRHPYFFLEPYRGIYTDEDENPLETAKREFEEEVLKFPKRRNLAEESKKGIKLDSRIPDFILDPEYGAEYTSKKGSNILILFGRLNEEDYPSEYINSDEGIERIDWLNISELNFGSKGRSQLVHGLQDQFPDVINSIKHILKKEKEEQTSNRAKLEA